MAVGGKATAHGAALLPGHPVTPCSQIFVRTALDGPKEWTILEMQGEFEAREAGQELNNLEIGTLTCKDGSNSVVLVIGNQRLDGKITELKQPLAVMSKTRMRLKRDQEAPACSVQCTSSKPSSEGDTEMAPSAQEAAEQQNPTCHTELADGGNAQVEYEIVGLVKRKLVFNHRPTIVTQYASPSKEMGSQRFV